MWLYMMVLTTCFHFVVSDISTGYSKPANPQAIDDQSFVQTQSVTNDVLAARYAALQESVAPSVHKYNVFWQSFESSAIPSDVQPVACPEGYECVPASDAGLKANGGLYNRFRCIQTAVVEQFQGYLELDEQHGFESAGVVWCAPPQYRDPSCLGQPEAVSNSGPENFTVAYQQYSQITAAALNKSATSLISSIEGTASQNSSGSAAFAQSALDTSGCSCVPTLASIPDYSDYITFLVNDLPMSGGRLTHIIVFNEVANAEWFDLSGTLPGTVTVTSQPSTADVQTWINRYSQIMQATHASVAAADPGGPVLIYASTDRYWSPPPVFTEWDGNRAHIGSETLVQGLWTELGITMDWSLAVHPYGDPLQDLFTTGDPDQYTFVSLTDVTAYMQQNYLQAGGTATSAAQLYLACSEQGWARAQYTDDQRAQIICEAYNVTLATPSLLWTAHNDFQSIGSDTYGLVPLSVVPDLANGLSSVIFQAYSATNLGTWQSGNHYCCDTWQIGC